MLADDSQTRGTVERGAHVKFERLPVCGIGGEPEHSGVWCQTTSSEDIVDSEMLHYSGGSLTVCWENTRKTKNDRGGGGCAPFTPQTLSIAPLQIHEPKPVIPTAMPFNAALKK